MPNLPLSASDGIFLQDHFAGNDAVADALVGELRWEIVTIGNASTLAYVTQQPAGVLRFTTAVTADGDGAVLRGFTDGLILNGKAGHVRFRVRYPSITGNVLAGNNFRIGVDDSVTATSPGVGLWVDSDSGVLSVQADSADHGDNSAAVAGVSTLTSGTTTVLGTWHEFLLQWNGANAQGGPKTVELYVDGELAGETVSEIDDDEEVELKIAHWQDSGSGDTLELDIDFYEFYQAL